MNEEKEHLIEVDDLFVGLTRPATVMGIPYEAFVIEIVAVALVFLALGNPLWIALVIPLHFILYLIGGTDAGRFANWALYVQTQAKCLNRSYWSSSSFSPLRSDKKMNTKN